MRVEDLDGVHDRGDLLCIVIRDVKAEMLLHRQDKLDTIERIEAKILKTRRPRKFVVLALCSALKYFKDLSFD